MLLRLFISFVLFLLSSSAVFSTNVLLKSGGVIKGRVVNQDANQMIIIDETGISRTIQKSNILKTVYKEYSEQELAAIRKEEERKLNLAKQKKETTNQTKTNDAKLPQGILTKQLALSSVDENCFFHASKVEWYWFYGNFSITNPNAWEELLPEDDRPIKVSFQSTWVDTTLTLLIGSLTTISRKTKVVEVCEF
ncbi:hypothetical protein LEP1GSC202_3544 [Leptospira yanagawae serovar Saopaulo str. Sao Paulo = ATCC 700523]|uniref:Uncharacterized protein n=1 Tax=Leptospira yanagawae serovar Saopaulo str. Sao Paulo = ATCC 700523 TaxID=1249483 RepID=A0A5E8HB97_9LEPT|nr:hypothetical protein [Leptospira yanagawae]EOQ87276.1 hypothetical protein LEP1GSC202_3544 [Leptospira yanagawae serovar Saopaulo str. Sao Paulo = ATCC 700523]